MAGNPAALLAVPVEEPTPAVPGLAEESLDDLVEVLEAAPSREVLRRVEMAAEEDTLEEDGRTPAAGGGPGTEADRMVGRKTLISTLSMVKTDCGQWLE